MIRFYRTPRLIKTLYPSLIWNISSMDSVYLTFDDGPHPEITNWILDELSKYKAKATFFYVGENVYRYPELVQKTMSQGHSIGNHTYSHSNGWAKKNSLYLEDVQKGQHELDKLRVKKNLFRPPYGRIRRSQLKKLGNYRIIMWSQLAWDFIPDLDLDKSFEKLSNSNPGDILLFHENEKAFENLKILLPKVLKCFESQGYKMQSIQ